MEADNSTFGKFNCGDVPVVIDDVADLAKAAGAKIMEVYGKEGDAAPQANKVICDGLKKLYPSIPILSEQDPTAYSERKDWKNFWCVNALDGKSEFMKRSGEFTVNIGLCEDGKPIAGVVFCPALDPPVMYKGLVAAPPAIRENCDLVGGGLGYDSFVAIFPKPFTEEDSGLTLVKSSSNNSSKTDTFCTKYKGAKVVSKGSCLKLLMVAEGSAHIYPNFGEVVGPSEMKTCAAHAILKCGGGKLVQATPAGPDGPEVEYNKPDTSNPHFVAYGKVNKKKVKKTKKKIELGGSTKKEEAGISPMFIVLALIVALCGGYIAMQN